MSEVSDEVRNEVVEKAKAEGIIGHSGYNTTANGRVTVTHGSGILEYNGSTYAVRSTPVQGTAAVIFSHGGVQVVQVKLEKAEFKKRLDTFFSDWNGHEANRSSRTCRVGGILFRTASMNKDKPFREFGYVMIRFLHGGERDLPEGISYP